MYRTFDFKIYLLKTIFLQKFWLRENVWILILFKTWYLKHFMFHNLWENQMCWIFLLELFKLNALPETQILKEFFTSYHQEWNVIFLLQTFNHPYDGRGDYFSFCCHLDTWRDFFFATLTSINGSGIVPTQAKALS